MYIDFHILDCENPVALGMESREIPDSQITASSVWVDFYYHRDHRAANGRLNFIAGNGRTGAWSSGSNDLNQWLQVDFQRPTIITGVSTQGRQEQDQYVTKYTISFGDDGSLFYGYKSGQMLKVRRMNLCSEKKIVDRLASIKIFKMYRIGPSFA